MTGKTPENTPSRYAQILKESKHRLEMEANTIKHFRNGGMINLISEEQDDLESKHLIDVFAEKLGIEKEDIVNIDIESIVTAIEYGINTFKLEIPQDNLGNQTLAENVFQYTYRHFGENGKGWRIGRSYLLDSIKEQGQKSRSSLEGTPFAEFLKTLDLNLGEDRDQKPKLIVVQYPVLDLDRSITKPDDARLENLPEKEKAEVEKYLHIYSLISQVYPSKFVTDNPNGNIILNVVDPSYTWFLARNPRWITAYENLTSNKTETPAAIEKDEEIAKSQRNK